MINGDIKQGMRLSFINVGYGDSILIEEECDFRKFVMLIDGGKPDNEHYEGFPQRIRTIDYLHQKGIEKIDLLLITHLHEDHVGGLLEVVDSIPIDRIWCNYALPEEFLGKKSKCRP